MTDPTVEAMFHAMRRNLEQQGREHRSAHLVCHVRTLGGEEGDFAIVSGAVNVYKLAEAAREALRTEPGGDEVRG